MTNWIAAACEHLAWRVGGKLIDTTRSTLVIDIDNCVLALPVDLARVAEYGRALFEPLPIEPVRTAYADFSADLLENALLAPVPALLERREANRPWGVWLTHDIDFLRMSYQAVTHPARFLLARDIRGAARLVGEIARAWSRGTNPYWNLEDTMRLEQDHDVVATYFMLEQRPVGDWWRPSAIPFRYGMYRFREPAIAALLQRLAAGGMEIGLHGSFGTADDAARLRAEAESLRQVAGVPVVAARQHWLDFATWDTAEAYSSAGLHVASNLGFNPVGWGWRMRTAHTMRLPRADGTGLLPVVEVTPVIMDGALQGHDWRELLERILGYVIEHRTIVSVIWHNTVLRPGHPQLARYTWFLEQLRARGIPTPVGADLVRTLQPR